MRILCFILALLLPLTPAKAEIYIKKGAAPKPEHSAPAPQPEKNLSNEFANTYYKNCLKQKDDMLTADSQKSLCACTSAKMVEVMSEDEIKTMFTDTKEGQFQRARLINFVYVPCMQFPVHDFVLDNCSKNPNLKGPQSQEVCQCLANGMAKYVAEEGLNILSADPDFRNPDIQKSPLQSILGGRAFDEKSRYYATQCVKQVLLPQ